MTHSQWQYRSFFFFFFLLLVLSEENKCPLFFRDFYFLLGYLKGLNLNIQSKTLTWILTLVRSYVRCYGPSFGRDL